MREIREVFGRGERPYTRYMPGPFDGCQICGEAFSYNLTRCPLCHRTVCDSCAVRRGGCVFCGDLCAHAFFFGESDEDSETPEAQREE
jgi:hypothetical protein